MGQIRSRDTKPEMTVRSLLHSKGFRFTVNGHSNRSLPGKPDIVLPKYKTVIFVHGCFWHFHKRCREGRIPSSNREYWSEKLKQNVARDARNRRALRRIGWKILIVWECQLRDPRKLSRIMRKLLSALIE